MIKAIFLGMLVSSSLFAVPEDNESCRYKLMDTTFQKAIDKTHRIPDAQKWLWYGIKMSRVDEIQTVYWFAEIIKGNEYEIRDLFTLLAKQPHEIGNTAYSLRFYQHPKYVALLEWMTDTYVQHPDSFEQPADDEVDMAYQNLYELKEKRHEIGFDDALDKDTICRAAADAAGYFFWRNSFGYVQKHMEVMNRYDCSEVVESRRVAKDFSAFITGRPRELTEALEVIDRHGFLPPGYINDGND